MKYIKKTATVIALIILALVATTYATNTDYLLKAIRTVYLKWHVTAFLDDYHAFDNRTVQNDQGQEWPQHKSYNHAKASNALRQTHDEYGTIAYVVIKNDSVFYEQYYDGYDKSSNTNSFSMVKSMISGLLGKAIMDGHIQSLEQPVGDFFP